MGLDLRGLAPYIIVLLVALIFGYQGCQERSVRKSLEKEIRNNATLREAISDFTRLVGEQNTAIERMQLKGIEDSTRAAKAAKAWKDRYDRQKAENERILDEFAADSSLTCDSLFIVM